MTEGIEHALEVAFSGVLFCGAVILLLWLHGAFCKQLECVGICPEQMILFEESGG
ncbi:MAG: hypothetical protein IJZ55_10600 [Lachnospiraceae bacterium]|nr:hypothetical protein [Lachnospiraceae bacterium]